MPVLQVFMAHTYLELQQNEQAVRIYDGLSQAGLAESTYIMAQVGHVMTRLYIPIVQWNVTCRIPTVCSVARDACTLTISPFRHLKRFF